MGNKHARILIAIWILLLTQNANASGYAHPLVLKEKLERHDGYASLFASAIEAAHNYGTDLHIDRQLELVKPRVTQDLAYAGTGGILVVARIESVTNDAGTFRSLVGGRIYYVGLGQSAVEAEIAHISRPQIKPDTRIDSDASVAYWFTKNVDGTLKMSAIPLSSIMRNAALLLSERSLSNFDWRAYRESEYIRIVRVAAEKITNSEASDQIKRLAVNRSRSLDELKSINDGLKAAQDRAETASANLFFLSLLNVGTSFASFVATASSNLAEEDARRVQQETTSEGVSAELDAIQKNAESAVKQLRERMIEQRSGVEIIDWNLRWLLKEHSVPIDNLPPEQAPSLR